MKLRQKGLNSCQKMDPNLMLFQTLDQSVQQRRLEDVEGRQGAQQPRLSLLSGGANNYGLDQSPAVETNHGSE